MQNQMLCNEILPDMKGCNSRARNAALAKGCCNMKAVNETWEFLFAVGILVLVILIIVGIYNKITGG